jgi:hypothetical protein
MRALIDWLMQDERKDVFEIVVALSLNTLFLALIALLLWPLGKASVALSLAQGYGCFWIVTIVVVPVIAGMQRFFRVDMYSRGDAYVISNLLVSSLLIVSWSAFAALTAHRFIIQAPLWVTIIVYLVGLLSCFMASVIVGAFYQGQIYRLVNLPLAFMSFLLFAVWPAAGRTLYGWLF